MIKEGDTLYCYKDYEYVGSICFNKGKFYKVIEISYEGKDEGEGRITMIDNKGDEHFVFDDIDYEKDYRNFFGLREVNLKKLLDD